MNLTIPVEHFIQQDPFSCGYAACLTALSSFRTLRPSHLESILESLGTDEDGTSQSALIRTLRAEGARVGLYYDLTYSRIQRFLTQNRVIITYDHLVDHWLLLIGVRKRKRIREVLLSDPEHKQVVWCPYDSISKRLQGFGITCSPKKRPT